MSGEMVVGWRYHDVAAIELLSIINVLLMFHNSFVFPSYRSEFGGKLQIRYTHV